jgi:hypothetical protein
MFTIREKCGRAISSASVQRSSFSTTETPSVTNEKHWEEG